MRLLFFLFFVCSASGMAPLTNIHIYSFTQQKNALENRLKNESDPEQKQAIAQLIRDISHVLKEQETKKSQIYQPSLTYFPTLPADQIEDEQEPLLTHSPSIQHNSTSALSSSVGMVQPPVRLAGRGPGMPHTKRSLESCCLSWLLCCQK